ncbi:MAG TPA: hypothetical protein VL651_05405 [Bacteroidia bacterium]|nr:hypothetical protein [Bacteroidia bacterium]
MKTAVLTTRLIIRIAAATFLTLLVSGASATPRVLPAGFGIKTTASGSGLSSAPTFTANYQFNSGSLEFGVNLQARKPHFSGVSCTYAYYLTKDFPEKAHLCVFTNINYNFSAFLNKRTVKVEERTYRESTTDFNSLRVRTLEMQLGFGLTLDHGSHFHSFYGIGAGMYHTIGTPELGTTICRERTAATLMLSAGISYSFQHKATQNLNSTL